MKYKPYEDAMTVREVVDELQQIKDHAEFRRFLNEQLFDAYKTDTFQIPLKLQADVAGLLFCAIHRSTDGPR